MDRFEQEVEEAHERALAHVEPEDEDRYADKPWGEQQEQIDYLERDVGDEYLYESLYGDPLEYRYPY